MNYLKAILPICLLSAFPAFSADFAISEVSSNYSESALTVHVGDTVKLSNGDSINHNVTIKAGGDDDGEDLGVQRPGQSINLKFPHRGVYLVLDSIHPKMKMTITAQ